MTTRKTPRLSKPDIDEESALAFATAGEETEVGVGGETAKKAKGGRSGLVPEGYVRLNANVRRELHTRIKIEAARQEKTIGDLIEELIGQHIPKLPGS